MQFEDSIWHSIDTSMTASVSFKFQLPVRPRPTQIALPHESEGHSNLLLNLETISQSALFESMPPDDPMELFKWVPLPSNQI